MSALKRLTVCIHVFLAAMCLCAAASADETGACGENLTYTLTSAGVLTISGTGEMNAHPWENSSIRIKSVIIEPGATNVYGQAFCWCGGQITSVSIPDTVTRIEERAFESYANLKEVVIPDSVTELGKSAFAHCTMMSRMILSKNLTVIPPYCFTMCGSLTEVTIPEGVTLIETMAFYWDLELTSLFLPKSVKTIYSDAFGLCLKLSDVYYAGTAEDRAAITIEEEGCTELLDAVWHYSFDPDAPVVVKGGVYKLNAAKNAAVFVGPQKKSAKTLVIQDMVKIWGKSYNVTEILPEACMGMSKLKKITIGKNVTAIGAKAFFKCKKAEEIILTGTALKKVDKNAFGKGLKNVRVRCPKKKLKTYKKLLKKAGLSKKAVWETK